VTLKKAKYHSFNYDCDDKEEKVYTSKRYTVVNLGTKVKVVPADGDNINAPDNMLFVDGGNNVTLQNYKNTWYVVA
jgi:hypothetical protein